MFNMAGVIRGSTLVCEYAKQCLPNVQVFDEVRYFTPGDRAAVFDLEGIPTALSVCEDIWHSRPMAQAREAGARLMINLNASPFHKGNRAEENTTEIQSRGHIVCRVPLEKKESKRVKRSGMKNVTNTHRGL